MTATDQRATVTRIRQARLTPPTYTAVQWDGTGEALGAIMSIVTGTVLERHSYTPDGTRGPLVIDRTGPPSVEVSLGDWLVTRWSPETLQDEYEVLGSREFAQKYDLITDDQG
jgi:hypothetical protein